MNCRGDNDDFNTMKECTLHKADWTRGSQNFIPSFT